MVGGSRVHAFAARRADRRSARLQVISSVDCCAAGGARTTSSWPTDGVTCGGG